MTEHLTVVHVPAEPIYRPETLSDCNFGTKIVVEPTGAFGLGIPLFIRNIPLNEEPVLGEDEEVRTILAPTTMWYPHIDPPADQVVNGRLVIKAQIVPTHEAAQT